MQARTLAVLFLAFFPLFAQQSPPERGTVEGTVTHAITGQPIAGARVRLESGPQDPIFTTTNDEGHYRFTGLDFSGYRLDVAKPGFLEPGETPHSLGFLGSVSISTTHAHAELHVKLQPQAVIAGKILDTSGAPLPDAVVVLLRMRPPRPGQQQLSGLSQIEEVARATSNDLGEYRLAPLPEGAYYLQVQPNAALRFDKSYRETYYPGSPDLAAAKRIEVGSGQEIGGVDIRILRVHGVRVAGRLINAPEPAEGERPRAYTRLVLARPDPEPRNYLPPFASTMNARFELTDVLPGRYMLEALTQDVPENPMVDAQRQRSTLWARMPVVVGESGLDGIEVTLEPTFEIPGTLKFPEGCRATRVAVRVFTSASRLIGPAETVSADDGSFVLRGLVPGNYHLGRVGQTWPISAQLDGKDALSGFELTTGTKGPLQLTMTCAEARVSR